MCNLLQLLYCTSIVGVFSHQMNRCIVLYKRGNNSFFCSLSFSFFYITQWETKTCNLYHEFKIQSLSMLPLQVCDVNEFILYFVGRIYKKLISSNVCEKLRGYNQSSMVKSNNQEPVTCILKRLFPLYFFLRYINRKNLIEFLINYQLSMINRALL